jgi:hypothetical protein
MVSLIDFWIGAKFLETHPEVSSPAIGGKKIGFNSGSSCAGCAICIKKSAVDSFSLSGKDCQLHYYTKYFNQLKSSS